MQKNQREIKRIHEEIKEDYAFAVKKSVVDFVLKEPEIDEDERFLDEDDETPMTIELAAVSEAWKKLYRSSKRHLNHHLHLINQCMLQAQVGGWASIIGKYHEIVSIKAIVGYSYYIQWGII